MSDSFFEDILPADSHTLIAQLDAAYPPRCIAVGETEIEAHRYAAVRAFVDELVALKEEDQGANHE